MFPKKILSLLTLILSVGILSVIPFSDAAEHNQICIDKVWIENSKGEIACVTPSTADTLVERGWGNLLGENSFVDKSEMKESETGQDIFETRIGTLTLESGYPTAETQRILEDEVFYQRAVQVYLLSYSAVAGAGIFDEFDEAGAYSGDVIYWSDFVTSDSVVATPNRSVIYSISFLDLSEGPMIVVAPSNLNGGINNLYQQPLVDIGLTGPDKGEGGKFLILPPGYDDSIPDGYFVVSSDTIQNFYLARGSAPNGDTSIGVQQVQGVNIYKLSEVDDPPEQKFVDVAGIPFDLMHPTTDGFWEFLHKVYSKETIVRPEDKLLVGLMHTIGVVPGESFSPDENSRVILDEAALVGHMVMKNTAFNSPHKHDFTAYPSFSNWEFVLQTTDPMFEDDQGIPMIDQKNTYVHQAAFTADGMVVKTIGKGSQYLSTFRDGNGDWLDGSNQYSLHVPANIPIENFWSVIVYDVETRSMIKNNLQLLPGISSLDTEKLIQNSDGSYDLYFGPEPPEGYESNWIKTNEGDGFFVYFRFYGPTDAFFDKIWQLPDVELVK